VVRMALPAASPQHREQALSCVLVYLLTSLGSSCSSDALLRKQLEGLGKR